MTSLLLVWSATVIGLGIATFLTRGIKAKSFSAFIIAATVLSLINVFIRPLLWLLTAPLSVLTFGLFVFVINALMIMLAAALVPGFEVKGFGSALLGAIIMVVIGVILFISVALITGAEINWYSYEYHSQGFH